MEVDIDIAGYGKLRLEHVVMDCSGTLEFLATPPRLKATLRG